MALRELHDERFTTPNDRRAYRRHLGVVRVPQEHAHLCDQDDAVEAPFRAALNIPPDEPCELERDGAGFRPAQVLLERIRVRSAAAKSSGPKVSEVTSG